MSSWPLVRLGDICEKITDGTHHSPPNSLEGEYKYITAKNIKPWGLDLSDITYVDAATHREIYARCDVRKDDILYVKDGATTGRLAINPLVEEFSLLSSVGVLRAGSAVRPRYLAYALQEPTTFDRMMADTSGVAITRLTLRKLNDAEVRLAPLECQDRIVEKLDELFSDLDAGVAELKAAQRKLMQYRQSLLKAAVEGALTADWRAARYRYAHSPATSCPRTRASTGVAYKGVRDAGLHGQDLQETGADLLERILTERRARWEQKQRARYAEQGKTPPKGWQAKYPEPVAPDLTNLPALPESWVWASLDMLGEIASGVAKGTKRAGNVTTREIPYLRVANVQRGYLDLTQIKTIEATESDIAELQLRPGDVLFNEGGDLDKLGRGWVWCGEVAECIHQNHVFRMRPALPATPSEFISHHGNSFGKEWFKQAGKQTTNLASINMTMLRAFPVPVPPESESAEIVSRVQAALDNVGKQEQAVAMSLKQAAAQRKNLLKAAFAGQLVPQDPADEPASALLERIRAARADQAGKSRRLAKRGRKT